MEKERGIKALGLVALITAILGLTVAFAALSQTLTINGTATVNAAEWDIHFANLNALEPTGGASILTAPTIKANEQGKENTVIGDYSVVLTKPGDSIKYTFDVVNDGTIDATLTSIEKATVPTCTSTSGIEQDATTLCAGLTYTLTYTDTGIEVANGDLLNKKSSENLTLTLSFNGDTQPSDDVEISDLDIILNYSQK